MDVTDNIVYISLYTIILLIPLSMKRAFNSSSEVPYSMDTISVRGTMQSRIFYIGKVKCILEYFDLGVNFFSIVSVLDAALNEIVQIYFCKCFVTCFFIHFLCRKYAISDWMNLMQIC